MALDASLPTVINSPSAWIGKDMLNNQDAWLFKLSTEDITELENAAHHYLSLDRDIGEISAADFPLTRFAKHLQSLQHKLLHGNGIEVIRGLPIEAYTQEFAATIFCGLGAHLGSARSQNAAGHILGHVRDTGASSADLNTRIYQTAERQSFHTDSADVVGLLCIRQARQGGKSLLVSADSIYNKMRSTMPGLIREAI